MTNPDDPRTPQERAYDDTTSGTAEQRTEWLGTAEQRTEWLGTAEQRTEWLGTAEQPQPTQALPPYDPRFDPQAPPPSPTRAYPQYVNAQYPGQSTFPDRSPEKRSRPIGTWIAATVAALLLVAVVGLGIALLTGGPDNSSPATAAGPTTSHPPTPTPSPKTTTPAPPQTSPQTTQPSSPLDRLPGGIGEAIGAAGAAVGTITANDGTTLTLDSIGGSKVTVVTNAQTTVIALNGATVADLRPGSTVMVQGSRIENGAMTAKTIISTELPTLGGR